jgi:thioredoxin reductase (NADPH)
VVDEIVGSDKVEKVIVTNKKTGIQNDIALDGVFIAVGITPNLNNIEGLPSRDEGGYIIADESCETSIPGVYAAGDVRTKQLRQVITAAADGANAITYVERYLNSLV